MDADGPPFKCHCGASYTAKSSLARHVGIRHPEEARATKSKEWVGQDSLEGVGEHFLLKVDEEVCEDPSKHTKRFKCALCGSGISRLDTLQKHMRTTHKMRADDERYPSAAKFKNADDGEEMMENDEEGLDFTGGLENWRTGELEEGLENVEEGQEKDEEGLVKG